MEGKDMSRLMQIVRVAAVATMLLVDATSPLGAQSDGATYTYDALGRLTQVTYTNGTTIVYTYDAAGNRTSVVVTCSASGC
jgi:YD repeat-containing protein